MFWNIISADFLWSWLSFGGELCKLSTKLFGGHAPLQVIVKYRQRGDFVNFG